MQNLTSKDFLKFHACDALNAGSSALTKAERYAQVLAAKQVRNFWFTSSIMGNAKTGKMLTPRFSEPIIVTDMISTIEQPLPVTSYPPFIVEILRFGGQGGVWSENWLGIHGPALSQLLIKYEANGSGAWLGPVNTLDKWLPFVPRMLRPFETLSVAYNTIDGVNNFLWPVLGLRTVRVFKPDNPYAQLSPISDRQVRRYINSDEPETFFLEVKTPLASLGAKGAGFVELRTPQLDRPVLILGAASNAQGCQARLSDESDYYQFTYQDPPKGSGPFAPPLFTDPPLGLWAPNTDYRNTSLFCMWPVPHMLDPGDMLKLRLFNGLVPDRNGGLSQAAGTRGDAYVRITFICRTV